MTRIAIISNPTSRRNRLQPHLAGDLAEIAGEHATLYTTPNLEAVDEAARDCLAQGVEVLALNGGDGTNHHTLTRFIQVYGDHPLPAVYLLRGGTMNSVADSLGVRRGRPRTLMRRLIRWAEGELELNEKARHLMRILPQEGDDSSQDGWYGFLFCNGIASRFLQLYYKGGNASVPKAAMLVLRTILSAAIGGPFARTLFGVDGYRVKVDEEEVRGGTLSGIFVGTVRQIGFGFAPWPEVLKTPGHLGLIGIPRNPLYLLLRLPAIFLGRVFHSNRVPVAYGHRLNFESSENSYYLDGDFHEHAGPVTIVPGPRLRVLVG